ncbi:MAG: Flp family type IVb pilin [Armatimonadota bacterium]
MFDALKAYWKDEEGLTTVEYALLLALIVVVAITAWTQLGANVNTMAQTSANAMQ